MPDYVCDSAYAISHTLWLMFFWHNKTRVQYVQEQRSQSPESHGSSVSSINHTGGLLTAHRTTDNCVCLSILQKHKIPEVLGRLWIIPALLCLPPSLRSILLPPLPPLWTSEVWHTRSREQRSRAAHWALRNPAPWRGEKQDFISYASFSISAIARGICRRVSSVVFLMRCYTSSPLMHTSQEQLCF